MQKFKEGGWWNEKVMRDTSHRRISDENVNQIVQRVGSLIQMESNNHLGTTMVREVAFLLYFQMSLNKGYFKNYHSSL
jgi:hypothetical protein